MNKTEQKAKRILKKMGWQPIEIKGYNGKSGYPDFACKDNKHVEVKKLTSQYFIQCNITQLKKWDELLFKNNQVFLMIFSNSNKYLMMFEIKGAKKC